MFFVRLYVVTKFILPTVDDLKFPSIDFDMECSFLNANLRRHQYAAPYLPNMKNFCTKIVPFIDFYKKQIDSCSKTAHDIFTSEIPLILPNFPKNRREKRSLIASLVTFFIGLVYEGISSYLHNKRQKALKKAFVAMENQVNLQRNKIFHLKNLMVMYGIYNSDMLEKLTDTEHKMHNKTTWNEKLCG